MHPLISCLPHYLAADLLQHPHYDPVAQPQRFEVIVLFADISGFTPMSESLARTGKKGTEELTTLLNQYFGAMIELIQAYGGTVAKFGGDALTVLFPCVDTATLRQEAARRALTCALAMQQQMTAYQSIVTSAGTFALAMKAGLAIGEVFSTSVGQSNYLLEYIVAGSVLERAALAEHYAQSGDIISHRDLLPLLGEIESSLVNNDFVKVSQILQAASPAPLPALPTTLPSDLLPVFAAYLHPTIAHLLVTAGQADFINEHRKVSVLFIGFDGFDYDHDAQVAAKLQNYLWQMLEIIRNYDGHLRQVEMGDKGSKYIVLFGAPLAHEDDEVRALHCALDLRQAAHALGISTRTGLNTGQVFCGLVGSDLRREYAAIGDAVNLSARLMQAAAPGQILLSEATHQAVPAAAFSWQTLEPILVKGKTAPVTIFGLEGVNQVRAIRLQEPHYVLPMVGRATELAIAAAKLDTLLVAQQGQLLGIVGEAGIGKSRLVAEIIQLANAHWLIGYGGECHSYGTSSNYLVWQPILRAFFGINQSWDVADQISVLETQLSLIDPALLPRLPLLSAIFNLPIPDNDLTHALEGQLRKTSLEALLIDCLKARAKTTPLLLVLEDCHWLDPLSHDLLESLGRAIVDLPIIILLAYRPPELERLQTVRVTQLPHYTEIRLKDFTPDEAERLISLKLAQFFGPEAASLPDALTNQLKLRAAGNPFYIEELLNYLQSKGLDPHQTQNLEYLDLPSSLESLIISRIDQLTEEERITIKVASVIGRLFKANWLWQIYPQIGEPEKVKQQLENLSYHELTPLDKPEPELEYLFKHIITQEVAYESLALATRTVLHEQIAAYIELTYADRLEQYLDLLAYHYGRSPNLAKQRQYFQQAGDAARLVYANEVAIEYYQRLLNLLEAPPERLTIMLKLGQILELIGRWDAVATLYHEALAMAISLDNLPFQSQSQRLLGRLAWKRSDYPEALTWLSQASANFEQANDQEGVSTTFLDMGNVYTDIGDYPQAQVLLETAQQLCQELDDKSGLNKIYNNLGRLAYFRGEFNHARSYWEMALALAQAADDRLQMANALNNLGVVFKRLSDLPMARRVLEESLRLKRELGDKRGVGNTLVNLGDLALYQGDFEAANLFGQESLVLRQELGDKWGIANTLSNLGDLAHFREDFTLANSFWVQSLSLMRELGNQNSIALLLTNLGMCAAHLGDYNQASQCLAEGLAIYQKVGDKGGIALALVVSGSVAHRIGNYPDAFTNLHASLRLGNEIGDKITILQNLVTLVSVTLGFSLQAQAAINTPMLQLYFQKAVQLAAAAENLVKSLSTSLEPFFRISYNRDLALLGTLLTPTAFKVAWDTGSNLEWEQTVALALQSP